MSVSEVAILLFVFCAIAFVLGWVGGGRRR
jgi:hypothetical protein